MIGREGGRKGVGGEARCGRHWPVYGLGDGVVGVELWDAALLTLPCPCCAVCSVLLPCPLGASRGPTTVVPASAGWVRFHPHDARDGGGDGGGGGGTQTPAHPAWDGPAVAALLDEYADVVRAYFCGHHHPVRSVAAALAGGGCRREGG